MQLESDDLFNGGVQQNMQKFTCGVKHNFDSGVVIENDDRKKYDWNCSTCEIRGNLISKVEFENFKASGKVICPLLTYE